MNKKKWISKCGRYTVYLNEDTYDNIVNLAKKYFPKEIGTSLIGYYSENNYEAYITELTPIATDSISENFSFTRGVKGLRKYYKNLFKKTKGGMYYLGEWHSHPNGTTSPSATDDINQSRISMDRITQCPESILIICAYSSFGFSEIGVYVYSRKSGKIYLLPD